MPEQVAVVDARAAAELAHRVAELRRDERVDHHCRTAPCLLHGDVEVLDVLDPRVPNLLEGLIGELGLEREHEACAVSPVESETMCSSTGTRSSFIRGRLAPGRSYAPAS